MEELENSISVKVAKEPVMNIIKLNTLFKPTNGFLEIKVYIAGLPITLGNTLIKQVTAQTFYEIVLLNTKL